jgi:hypothetical protein
MSSASDTVEFDPTHYERLRDGLIIATQNLSDSQIFELCDELHTTVRRRRRLSWQQGRSGASGFA